jgi:hypothetical protein
VFCLFNILLAILLKKQILLCLVDASVKYAKSSLSDLQDFDKIGAII